MGAIPATTDQVATIINGLISALLSGGETAAQAYIEALDPALFAIPIIGPILDEVLSLVLTDVQKSVDTDLADFADQITFSLQAQSENSALVQAAKQLAAAKTQGDQNAIATATQTLVSTWGSLIHSDGSATP